MGNVYWQIGTDIKLLFPTEKEYKEAKKKIASVFPILCKTCLHENNYDGQCGFAGGKINNCDTMGNMTACTYYDATKDETTRIENCRKLIQDLGVTSVLGMYKVTNPDAYKVFTELLKLYGVSSEK
jgi:hypothetical protein